MKSQTEVFGDKLWHYAILNDSIRRVEFHVRADPASANVKWLEMQTTLRQQLRFSINIYAAKQK